MDADDFGGASCTEVRLVRTDSGVATVCTVSAIDPFMAEFIVPSGLQGYNYYVETRNNAGSAGQSWIRLRDKPGGNYVTFNVFAKTQTDADALALNVSWSQDFKWNYVKNVKTDYGAVGDGVANDTTAIQNAINAVNTSGGGVVYFPTGTYNHTYISMKTGVILKGQSNTNTKLKYIGTGGSVLKAIDQNTMGAANLTFIADTNTVASAINVLNWGNGTASKLFVYNCKSDYPYNNLKLGHIVSFGKATNTLIANNYFVGTLGPVYSAGKDYVIMRNNNFFYSQGSVTLAPNKFLVENNVFQGMFQSGTTIDLHGCTMNGSNNMGGYPIKDGYVANNLADSTATTTANDGESFSVEDPDMNYLFGTIASATSNTAVLNKTYQVSVSNPWAQQWQVVITSGQGLGQLRDVISYSNDNSSSVTVELDRNWDIIPDSTSKYTLLRTSSNLVYYSNTMKYTTAGVLNYHNSFDNVIENNTSLNGGGPQVWGRITSTKCEPSYFIQVKGNYSVGESKRGGLWTGLNLSQEGMGTTPYAVIAFGNEFRGNTMDRSGCGLGNEVTHPSDLLIAYRTTISSGYGAYANLIESNTFKNSSEGIWLSTGLQHTMIRNNNFTGVTTRLVQTNGGDSNLHDMGDGTGAPLQDSFRLEAEKYVNSSGGISWHTNYISGCDANEWIRYYSISCGSGFTKFTANVSCPQTGRSVQIVDDSNGSVLGTLNLPNTGTGWATVSTTLPAPISGIKNIKITFNGGTNVGSFGWFELGN